MASIFRPTYTAVNRRTGERELRQAKKYYAKFRDADGRLVKKPLSTNKEAALVMLGELVKKKELTRAGCVDPFERHRKAPLKRHLKVWGEILRAEASPKYAARTYSYARRVLRGAKARGFADLAAADVQLFLASLREDRPGPALDPCKEQYTRRELADLLGVGAAAVSQALARHRLPGAGHGRRRRYPAETARRLVQRGGRGISVKTCNEYLAAVKAFTAWLARERRTPHDPLSHLQPLNEDLDRRHDRQTLTVDQVRAVVEAARASARAKFGLTGPQRAALYLAAIASGFRAEELACLTPANAVRTGGTLLFTLARGQTKNRQGAEQPLPADLAAELVTYIRGRPPGEPLWPGRWYKKAAELLRVDLDAAGVAYVVDGPEGPLFADFHALRHSYVARLEEAGLTVREQMDLSRHSTPVLTLQRYGKAARRAAALAAVQRLPAFFPAPGALNRTGTA